MVLFKVTFRDGSFLMYKAYTRKAAKHMAKKKSRILGEPIISVEEV